MRKLVWILVVLGMTLVLGQGAFAAEKKAEVKKADTKKSALKDVWVDAKDFSLNASIGLGYYINPMITVGGEYGIHKFVIADKVPLTVGVSAKLGWSFYTYQTTVLTTTYPYYRIDNVMYNSFGLGAFATIHFSPKCFNWNDFLNKLDVYYAMGLSFNINIPANDIFWPVGFATYGGISYFFNDKLSIFLEETYWNWGTTAFGISYKF